MDDKENTPTEVWTRVKSWLGWGGGGTPTQIFSDGKMVTRPAGLASSMNRFFQDKIKTLRNSIPAVFTDPLAKMKEAMRSRSCSLHLKAATVEDVLKIISHWSRLHRHKDNQTLSRSDITSTDQYLSQHLEICQGHPTSEGT